MSPPPPTLPHDLDEEFSRLRAVVRARRRQRVIASIVLAVSGGFAVPGTPAWMPVPVPLVVAVAAVLSVVTAYRSGKADALVAANRAAARLLEGPDPALPEPYGSRMTALDRDQDFLMRRWRKAEQWSVYSVPVALLAFVSWLNLEGFPRAVASAFGVVAFAVLAVSSFMSFRDLSKLIRIHERRAGVWGAMRDDLDRRTAGEAA